MDRYSIVVIVVMTILLGGFIVFMLHYHFVMTKEQRCEKRSTILGNEIVTYNNGCAEYYVTEKGYELKELKPQWGDDAYILQKGVTTGK